MPFKAIVDALKWDDGIGEAVQRQRYAGDVAMGRSTIDWNNWVENAIPALQYLSKNRTTDDRTNEEIGLAAGDIKDQYANARTNLTRALGSSRNPGDPGYADILARSYGDEAAATGSAITTARRAERARVNDTNWGRALQTVSAYQGLPTDARANLEGASASARGSGALALGSQNANSAAAGQLGYAGGYAADKWFSNKGTTAGTKGYDELYGGKTYGEGSFNGGGQRQDDGMYYDSRDDGGGQQAGGVMSLLAKDGGKVTGRRALRLAYSDGGEVKGPGTGTSDSIKAKVKPGSYILSADTTRAIGMQKVNKMFEAAGVRPGGEGGHDNNGIPIRLSNGEVQVPPAVVRHHGEEFFNKLQQKYHRPVADDDTGMANGGALRKRALPRNVEDAIFRAMPARALRGRG